MERRENAQQIRGPRATAEEYELVKEAFYTPSEVTG